MATANREAAKCVGTTTGGPPVTGVFPEAASLTAKAGEVVYLVGGYITECSDNPTAMLGIAAEDGHNSTAGAYNINVHLFVPENLFEANTCGASGASIVTALTMVGGVWQLYRDTTNSRLCVQVNQPVTNPRVAVWSLCLKDAVGDAYGRVIWQPLGKYCQIGATS